MENFFLSTSWKILVNISGEDTSTLFKEAARDGQLVGMQKLCEKTDCSGSVIEAFRIAAAGNHRDVLFWLLNTDHWNIVAETRRALFLQSAKNNWVAGVDVFLKIKVEDINDLQRGAAFITAVENGHLSVVKLLVNYAFSAKTVNRGLLMAAKGNYFPIVQCILQETMRCLEKKTKESIYLFAAAKKQYAILVLLKDVCLDIKKQAFIETISRSQTMMMWFLDNVNIGKEGIEKGFELATAMNKVAMVQFIWAKANQNISHEIKIKTFILAATLEHPLMLLWFLKHIRPLSIDKENALIEAARHDKLASFELLLQNLEHTLSKGSKEKAIEGASHFPLIIAAIRKYEYTLRMERLEKYTTLIKNILSKASSSFIERPSKHSFLLAFSGALMSLIAFNVFSLGIEASLFYSGVMIGVSVVGLMGWKLIYEKVRLVRIKNSDLYPDEMREGNNLENSSAKGISQEQLDTVVARFDLNPYLISYSTKSRKKWNLCDTGMKVGFEEEEVSARTTVEPKKF